MSRIKFLQEHEVPVASGDMVFRQGLWRSSIACGVGGLILMACLTGPSLASWFGWHLRELGYIAYYAGFIVALLMLFTGYSLKMSLVPTNWVMRLALNGIYLRYRSYLNGDYPGEPVAAFIPSGAIAWIRPVVEKSTQIDTDGEKLSITHRRLEIRFREAGLADLKQQIDRERKRRIPARLGSKGVFRHYPVRVTADDTIQIDWRDAHMATTPGFKAAAAILARHYPSREAEYKERADAMALDRRGQETEILNLVEAGEIIQAVKLTKRLYRLSTTDAKAFIDDLTA